MEKFVVVRDDALDLEFTGERLGSAGSDDTACGFTCTLYRTEGGRYVLAKCSVSRYGADATNYANVYGTLEELLEQVNVTPLMKRLFKEAGIPTTKPVDPQEEVKPESPSYELLIRAVGPHQDSGSYRFELPSVGGVTVSFVGTELAEARERTGGVRMRLFVSADCRYLLLKGGGPFDHGITLYANKVRLTDKWDTFDDMTRSLLVGGGIEPPEKLP